ncbi:MAG TPA: DUF427 domain-containing protein [Streptosporangiaceae bacterium]|nr:DUF427 domain-containing protein [Streptosporangiaceae bacterium]
MSQRGYALLSDRARRPAAVLAAGCTVLAVVLGIVEHDSVRQGAFDTRVDNWIIGLFGHRDELIIVMRELGSPLVVTIVCAVIAGACALARRYRAALLVVITVPLASVITEFVGKPLVGRRFVGFLSYPSGHTTGIGALAVALIIVVAGPSARPLAAALRWALAVLAVAAVIDVILAVVAGQYHYFTDTIGAIGVSGATGLGTALALDRLAVLRAARQEAAGAARNPSGGQPVGTGMSAGHKITITPSEARIEVSVGGQKLADSRRAVVLAETGLPPRYYLPREDVRTDLLKPTSTESTCPFKGQAAYWSAEAGGEVHPDIVWSYESPIPGAEGIAGLMCFWTERGAEVTVDGAPAAGASAVSPH